MNIHHLPTAVQQTSIDSQQIQTAGDFPSLWCFTNVPHIPCVCKSIGAPWNANLAAHLLEERNKGPESRLHPYLNTLPQDFSCPLQLPPAILQSQVQYEPAVAAISSYQNSAREMYHSWCEVRSQSGQQQYSWGDWCWALHMVQSRSIRLAITGCKVLIPGTIRQQP